MKEEDNGKNKKPEKESLSKKIEKRSDNSEAIAAFLKGLTIQECIDTLESVKRKILSRTCY